MRARYTVRIQAPHAPGYKRHQLATVHTVAPLVPSAPPQQPEKPLAVQMVSLKLLFKECHFQCVAPSENAPAHVRVPTLRCFISLSRGFARTKDIPDSTRIGIVSPSPTQTAWNPPPRQDDAFQKSVPTPRIPLQWAFARHDHTLDPQLLSVRKMCVQSVCG